MQYGAWTIQTSEFVLKWWLVCRAHGLFSAWGSSTTTFVEGLDKSENRYMIGILWHTLTTSMHYLHGSVQLEHCNVVEPLMLVLPSRGSHEDATELSNLPPESQTHTHPSEAPLRTTNPEKAWFSSRKRYQVPLRLAGSSFWRFCQISFVGEIRRVWILMSKVCTRSWSATAQLLQRKW